MVDICQSVEFERAFKYNFKTPFIFRTNYENIASNRKKGTFFALLIATFLNRKKVPTVWGKSVSTRGRRRDGLASGTPNGQRIHVVLNNDFKTKAKCRISTNVLWTTRLA